jgi:hypothetical protein
MKEAGGSSFDPSLIRGEYSGLWEAQCHGNTLDDGGALRSVRRGVH